MASLIDEVDAVSVLGVIQPVDQRFVARTISADVNRVARRAAAFGLKLFAPGVAGFQQNGVAGAERDR